MHVEAYKKYQRIIKSPETVFSGPHFVSSLTLSVMCIDFHVDTKLVILVATVKAIQNIGGARCNVPSR